MFRSSMFSLTSCIVLLSQSVLTGAEPEIAVPLRATAASAIKVASEPSSPSTVPDALAKPTHKEVRIIRPELDGKPISLNTYCLDASGDILACCGGSSRYTRSSSASPQPAAIIKMSSAGEVLKSLELDFTPMAINVAPDGTIFVAGNGAMAKLTGELTLVKKVNTPNIANREAFIKKAREAYEAQAKQRAQMMEQQKARFEEIIAKLEKIPAADRTTAQEQQLKIYKQQMKYFATAVSSTSINVESLIQQKTRVTGLAVTDKDVFVSLPATSGSGYSIWRTDHDFANAKSVLTGVRGCCGQMDIQARDGKLFIAENTKFRVGIYNRDGEEESAFGKRDRKAVDGFGSCCNPMNVRCCPNGEILCAESSIGNIKRFSADGKFLGLVGKARIAAGCKHVAIAHDAKRDHYYMMNVDKGHIAVLVPLDEAPALTQREKVAKEAMDALGKRVIGRWQSVAAKKESAPEAARRRTVSASPFGSMEPLETVEFTQDGRTLATGSSRLSTFLGNTWEAERHEGDTIYLLAYRDGVEYGSLKVQLLGDNQMELTVSYGGNALSTSKYKRAE